MSPSNRFVSRAAICCVIVVLWICACSGNKSPGDAGADGGGAGHDGAAGGASGAAGGAGQEGGAGGSGGDTDAGACRLQGESCTAPQHCCGPLICAGICTMGVGGSPDAKAMCSYSDGGAPDGGAFSGVCPATGCPKGTVCVVEVGGVAGGGGEYCAPIPNECHGTPSCACMGSCVCTSGVGLRPETCSDTNTNGTIACDNGIR